MGNLLNKTRKRKKKPCETGKRDGAYQDTVATVLEHWVNYYFPEVNDENYWLKCESEEKNTNSIVTFQVWENSYLFSLERDYLFLWVHS